MKTPDKRKPKVYQVKRIDGGWEVFGRGGLRLSAEPRPKGDAVVHAKELARHDGAQVLVYGEDGKLESEFFYQQEERPSLARDDSVPSFAASAPVHHERR
jgi:hypothetical protein